MKCPAPKCKQELQVRYYINRTVYFCTCGYLKVNYKKMQPGLELHFSNNESILSNQEQS